MKTNKPAGRFPPPQRIRIEFHDEQAHEVCIAGTFNDWRPATAPMLNISPGDWVKDLTLPPGRYEYRLVVDGQWLCDPARANRSLMPMEGGALTLRAAMSHSAYSQSAPAPVLLKVDYASTAVPPAERPPLNIALVLDRSGSMAEDRKFPYTMDAAREVIVNLSERDIISVVAFNDRVVVLSPAGRAVNKPFLFHRLEKIAP